MLLSQPTKDALYKLSQKFFQMNRTWDNLLGYAGVKWAFSKFSSVFHGGYAHLFPLLADRVNEILLRYNEVPRYLVTLEDTRTYDTMLDMFETNLDEHEEAYEMLKEAIDIADANGDKNAAKELDALLRIFNRFMETAILLRDKAQVYGEANRWAFDAFSDQFYVITDVYDELTGGGDENN